MKSEKLFRETPFGGYKREDVLAYIEAADRAHKDATDELNERILELNQKLEEAAGRMKALERELEIKKLTREQKEALIASDKK